MPPPTVSVQSLLKSYGPLTAVDDVSFDALPGEIFGILGPNGAGKTTTIECTVGLRTPDSGAISLAGLDARRSPRQIKQRIGVTLQATTLPDKITPREALRLFASFYDNPERPDDLIARFSLTEKADAKFETLSGGQKQRVAIALAVINRPAVLFLDEPTAGLDPQARRELHDVIRAARAAGQTVVLTTHYIEEAQALCDRLAVIDRGRVIARGTPAQLVAGAKALPRVAFTSTRPVPEVRLRQLAGVTSVQPSTTSATLTTSAPPQTIIDLVKVLDADPGNELIDLQIHKPSLEDVFIELTGRTLRD
ncbi:MAG TPA: ABC transporter ATP-binding protein [Tepidisphaeraceae bacterium]|nr:ABC transporter ATP-binding protein [Tepidisphaeraceae bacterium]